MEEPLVSFELREKYLLVIGHGRRDNFTDMVTSSEMVFAKVLETNSRYLLVDNRALKINLNMNEAFNIVKRYEAVHPQSRDLVSATVIGPNGIEFGRFWKHVAGQRGFKSEVFEDFDEAEKWLMEQIKRAE